MFNNKPPRKPTRKTGPRSQYGDFEATELFCPSCRQAMPVRRRLLLVLPEGDKYEYLCARCGTSVGEKVEKDASKQTRLII